MIGNLTIDKASMNISYFLYSVKLLSDNNGKLSREDFINKMASFLGMSPLTQDGKENRTPYNKSKLPRYFGFIEVLKDTNNKDFLQITNRGKRLIPLIKENQDEEADKKYSIDPNRKNLFVDLIFESVVFDTFGKNNCGAEQSKTDVEPPKVLFKMLFDLEECTSEEFIYTIFGMNNGTFEDYDSAIETIKYNRSIDKYDYKTELEAWNAYNIASDCKLINIFTNEAIDLIKSYRNDTFNKTAYRLNENLDAFHLKQIENISPIYKPLRTILYFNDEKIDKNKWISESILGYSSSDRYLVVYKTDNQEEFIGKYEGTYCAHKFEEALVNAFNNPNKNIHLVMFIEEEDELLQCFGKYSKLLKFITNLQDQYNGWSKDYIEDRNLYNYLKNKCGNKINTIEENRIKIPANLQVIGVISMAKLDDAQKADYQFTRSVVQSGSGIHLSKNKTKGGYNKIFYGAPGCGKSYYVEHDVLDSNNVSRDNRFRTTFHPDYANSDFVGQIMPHVEGEKITYDFNPGPFALALKRTYETDEMVYLVIEEINRGNAAAIFGDLFQLLDRVKDSQSNNWGESEYAITNVGLQDYLKKELNIDITEIAIPTNLTILATMNTSDQSVFTLDTAFKRRWMFEQISNDIDSDLNHPYKNWFVPGTDVTWSTFLKKINSRILGFRISNSTNEDKRLGKYFVTKDCLTENPILDINNCLNEFNNFAYKVLEYLWNDVCKMNDTRDLFDVHETDTLEDLINKFKTDKLAIFADVSF